jgi:quinol monooxygenase YgiN
VSTLRHVVLLRFQAGSAAADVQRVEQAFAQLFNQIQTIHSLAWGTNNSPEGLDHGFTHCFTLEFADAAARDAYLVHPAHQAFSELARPLLADVLVIDHFHR